MLATGRSAIAARAAEMMGGRHRVGAGTGDVLGLEHEYYLTVCGRPADFRSMIRTLRIPGRRLDPGDVNAHRCPSGLAVTCDDAEAEIATPPLAVERGVIEDLAGWARHGRHLLSEILPPAVHLEGASTHLSVSVPDAIGVAVAQLYARTFAPALMLLAERPESHGIMVRVRPGRLELCTEFVDGQRLRWVGAFAVGSVRACTAAVADGATGGLPPRLRARIEPCLQRAGLLLRKTAFGPDLYRAGRAAVLQTEDGDQITADRHLASAWRAASPHMAWLLTRRQFRDVERDIRSCATLPTRASSPPTDILTRQLPTAFGEIVQDRTLGDVFMHAVVATWDLTILSISRGGRRAFAAVPRSVIEVFLAQCRDGLLDRLVDDYLQAEPAGRRLECFCQAQTFGLWDDVASTGGLIRPERAPFDSGDSGGPALLPAGLPGKRRPSRSLAPPTSGARPDDGVGRPSDRPRRGGGTGNPSAVGDPVIRGASEPRSPGGLRLAKPMRAGIPVIPEAGHRHVYPGVPVRSEPSPGGRRHPFLRWAPGIVLFVLLLIGGGIWAAVLIVRGYTGPDSMGANTTTTPVPPSTPSGPLISSASVLTSPVQPALSSSWAQVGTSPTPGRAGVTTSATETVGSTPSMTVSTQPAFPSSPPTASSGPAAPSLSGTRTVSAQVVANAGKHPLLLPNPLTVTILITRDRSAEPNPVAITITGDGLPTMTGKTVIGPGFGPLGGTISAAGQGSYAGFPTTFQANLTISPSAVTGTLMVGGDRSLPTGQPLILGLSGGGAW